MIANRELIALNQDSLGIQAKRVYTTIETEAPDTDYITNNNRCDVLAKPLADGSVAISFINLSDKVWDSPIGISADLIVEKLGNKMCHADGFKAADAYRIVDLWTGESKENNSGYFEVAQLEVYESVTIRVSGKAV